MAIVGVKSGALEGLTADDIKRIESAVIQQAINVAVTKLKSDPTRLVVRDLLPDQDFLDQNTNKFKKREWRQPVSGAYNAENTDVVVYKTGPSSKYEKKVLVIYGAKRVGTSLNQATGSLSAASITFAKGTSKTIAIIDLQRLETDANLRVIFQNPIIYEPSEEAAISFYPKTGASGSSDNIMLLGKVVEPLGENVAG